MRDPQVLSDLIAGGWRNCEFQPFRDGVEICRLYDRTDGPAVALLRYTPGAAVPRHRHRDLETILVLDGAQSDERGDYPTGSCILNPPGYEHSVWSEHGCVVLIHWHQPVEMLDAAPTRHQL